MQRLSSNRARLTTHQGEGPLPKEKLSGVVLCQCRKVYVGETQRCLATRVKKHWDACTKGDTWKSAIQFVSIHQDNSEWSMIAFR